ncbi:hypothetical protein E0Z10_g2446 [Xylaria hypoxylon]|uniref:BolA protein n=1 Tax=Xylaria hypoxylon TaxID=37992 RepID=A0A4Z0YPW7_9PEZI|nr:hypothetical protein E0Z10_g2446 [Xylaria hypoxylon]
MAYTTSITEASLKTALAERLKAIHVEVTDMSGKETAHSYFMYTICLPTIYIYIFISLSSHIPIPLNPAANTQFPCSPNPQKTGGCGQSFTSLIVSPVFAGQNSLKRHRAVNAALRDEIAAIHAWSAKCQTPEEWEKARAEAQATTTSTPGAGAQGGEPRPPLNGTVGGKVDGVNA